MLLIAGDKKNIWSYHDDNFGQNGDNIDMENSTGVPQQTKEKSHKRGALHRQVGRRTSDWILPIFFWIIGFAAWLTAWHFYQRTIELEVLNATLKQQVQLLEREHKK